MIVSLTGIDVIKINGRIIQEGADGDVAVLSFPNDLMNVKTGKNGNSIYAFNFTGQQCELSLRVIRGGADDQYLNGLLALMKNNPAAFSLMQGEFDKNIGDGQGNIKVDSYILSGGVFKKNVEVKENADGETEQSVSIYTMVYSNGPRTIG